MTRRAIVSADDFGMSLEVNDAIEEAHRRGILSTTSLMVTGNAAADAVRRARTMPDLKVGLHVVAIEGKSVLDLPAITDSEGWFGRDQFRLGVDYFFNPAARSAICREIEAQFRAFALTGLPLDHANAHKHMHLHPTVGRFLIESGVRHGLKAVRSPLEPPAPLEESDTIGDWALRHWIGVLRHQIRRAGLKTNDWCFGLRWSGHMTPDHIRGLIPRLPSGISEIYFHPATAQNAMMHRFMPDYDQTGELAALLNPTVREAFERAHVARIGWADL
ncbi:hopanoid biosynthesis-associated protein HpnK [Gluconobacter morbifer]|uniref:Sugar phosphotransferase system protein n=1 Tax=Gluconobacter morbifer G707 TaxID=1088869 RepID=G6XF37_9PROT|nr:hopanoid biosynthesis-associated protein HpnK [Gluconobacter morbifer]EHH68795.1 sugar phosphotransferase system protein [Gluconobacter morbifer G707]